MYERHGAKDKTKMEPIVFKLWSNFWSSVKGAEKISLFFSSAELDTPRLPSTLWKTSKVASSLQQPTSRSPGREMYISVRTSLVVKQNTVRRWKGWLYWWRYTVQYISYLSMITPCSRHGQYKSFSPVMFLALYFLSSSAQAAQQFILHSTGHLSCFVVTLHSSFFFIYYAQFGKYSYSLIILLIFLFPIVLCTIAESFSSYLVIQVSLLYNDNDVSFHFK